MRCKGIIKTHNSSESCICLWKFNFKDFKGFKGFKDFKGCKGFKGFKDLKDFKNLKDFKERWECELRGAEGLRRRHSISCE